MKDNQIYTKREFHRYGAALSSASTLGGNCHTPWEYHNWGNMTCFNAFPPPSLSFASYVVNMGLIEKLCCCFLSVQGPIDENPKIATFLQSATAVVHGMCQLCFAVNGR